MRNKRPKVFGKKEVAEFLGISVQRLDILMKRYDIPYQQISCGKIFFEDDIKEFTESKRRQKNLRFTPKFHKKE